MSRKTFDLRGFAESLVLPRTSYLTFLRTEPMQVVRHNARWIYYLVGSLTTKHRTIPIGIRYLPGESLLRMWTHLDLSFINTTDDDDMEVYRAVIGQAIASTKFIGRPSISSDGRDGKIYAHIAFAGPVMRETLRNPEGLQYYREFFGAAANRLFVEARMITDTAVQAVRESAGAYNPEVVRRDH